MSGGAAIASAVAAAASAIAAGLILWTHVHGLRQSVRPILEFEHWLDPGEKQVVSSAESSYYNIIQTLRNVGQAACSGPPRKADKRDAATPADPHRAQIG